MDLTDTDDLHLEIEPPSPADLEMIEIALCEWAASDDPHARQTAALYRDGMRANDQMLRTLERLTPRRASKGATQ